MNRTTDQELFTCAVELLGSLAVAIHVSDLGTPAGSAQQLPHTPFSQADLYPNDGRRLFTRRAAFFGLAGVVGGAALGPTTLPDVPPTAARVGEAAVFGAAGVAGVAARTLLEGIKGKRVTAEAMRAIEDATMRALDEVSGLDGAAAQNQAWSNADERGREFDDVLSQHRGAALFGAQARSDEFDLDRAQQGAVLVISRVNSLKVDLSDRGGLT